MRTLSGAFSVVLLQWFIQLMPSPNDPAIIALPLSLKLFILIALAALGMVAVCLFCYSLDQEYKMEKENKK